MNKTNGRYLFTAVALAAFSLLCACSVGRPGAIEPLELNKEYISTFLIQNATDSDIYFGAVDRGTCQGMYNNSTALMETRPDWAGTFVLRGQAYDCIQNLRKSEAAFNKALELATGSGPENSLLRGVAHVHLGDYAAALQDLTQALQGEGQKAQALFERGIIYFFYLDEKEKGLQDIRESAGMEYPQAILVLKEID